MALDRQSIEKKDFPIARRGYAPEAVDAHLGRLSSEVERLQRRPPAPAVGAPPAPPSSPASLAIAASEQVRTIVEAAETSAASIEESARQEAARIRSDAEQDARATRDEAVARSQDQVGAVGEATSLMLQRVEAMESEIGALVDSLRTGANRLGADLSLLQGNMGDLYDAAGASVPAVPEAAPVLPEPPPERALPPIPEAAPDPSPHEEAPVVPPGLFTGGSQPVLDEPYSEPEPEPAPVPTPEPGGGEGDVDGARLIALNMALNGASREETDAYLRDNFDLPDRASLVAEAFATVEG